MFKRLFPLIVFAIGAIVGTYITWTVWASGRTMTQAQFEVVADDAAASLQTRIKQHVALLVATQAHFKVTDGNVDRTSFREFIDTLDLDGEYEGIQGIGFAMALGMGDDEPAKTAINLNYGIERDPWPPTSEDLRTSIVLLEPFDERNEAAIGYDMYTEQRRQDAMRKAAETGDPAASAPVTLVQEITTDKQAGFLVYLPFTDRAGMLRGFVYAPFRAGDLHNTVLSATRTPIQIETRDAAATGDEIGEGVLFRTPGFRDAVGPDILVAERELEVAGRTWVSQVRLPRSAIPGSGNANAAITGLVTFLLASAMALAARWQVRYHDQVEENARANAQSLQEKDLMLQEMKHRIKNSISRILAIARQTASASDSISAFTDSFSARMQSMANAQDMLTRSHWGNADLRELLETELKQVYGNSLDRFSISGPPTELTGKQTQSLGLVFHEMATNSLKYGAGAADDGHIEIKWTGEGAGKGRMVHLGWTETGLASAPEFDRKGFGTRLIDASVRGELQGTIERISVESGFSVRLSFPAAAADVSKGTKRRRKR